MGKYASKVVEQAKAWLGRKSSDGTHKEIIDVYNSHKPLARGYAVKYTDAWCSTFVSAVAIKLGYTDIIPTECGCEKHIQLFKNKGIWVENENRTPKTGDIIFYDWNDNGVGDNKGNADHIGIVESVSGNKITVIEGNYNNRVARRIIDVNAKYIRGYGVPKYDAEPTEKKSISVIAREVIAGKWGNGTSRVNNLKNAGYTDVEIKAIQDEVNKHYNTPSAKDLNAVAKKVYRGEYGNGTARTKQLKADGYTDAEIKEIQRLVNAMYK